ncbi:hypothetical protein ES703_78350 [subsurface metagenome]
MDTGDNHKPKQNHHHKLRQKALPSTVPVSPPAGIHNSFVGLLFFGGAGRLRALGVGVWVTGPAFYWCLVSYSAGLVGLELNRMWAFGSSALLFCRAFILASHRERSFLPQISPVGCFRLYKAKAAPAFYFEKEVWL